MASTPELLPPEGPDWVPAPPNSIPGPSIWPAAVALATTFLLWGLISSLFITAVGLMLLIVSLIGWIAEIRHDRKRS